MPRGQPGLLVCGRRRLTVGFLKQLAQGPPEPHAIALIACLQGDRVGLEHSPYRRQRERALGLVAEPEANGLIGVHWRDWRAGGLRNRR